MKVLFVGNSYTFFHQLPEVVASFGRYRGVPVELERYLRGGASLQTHWCDNLGLFEQRCGFCPELDPQRVGGLDRALEARPDVALLQGQSMDPVVQPESFYAHAALLAQRIHASGCNRIVFYMTWARRDNPEQQMILTGAYRKIAAELGGDLAPVGQAWADVRGQLPRLVLHEADGSHPAPAGSYLSACVLLETLTGRSCIDLPARLEEIRDDSGRVIYDLPPETACPLQRIAHGAVDDFAKDC